MNCCYDASLLVCCAKPDVLLLFSSHSVSFLYYYHILCVFTNKTVDWLILYTVHTCIMPHFVHKETSSHNTCLTFHQISGVVYILNTYTSSRASHVIR